MINPCMKMIKKYRICDFSRMRYFLYDLFFLFLAFFFFKFSIRQENRKVNGCFPQKMRAALGRPANGSAGALQHRRERLAGAGGHAVAPHGVQALAKAAHERIAVRLGRKRGRQPCRAAERL